MNRQTITVDIAPGSGPVQRLKVSQGDIGRPLGVYIIQNGAPLDCSGYNADLYVLKPDGNYYVASATVATTPTNLVTWITATQETPIAGECKAQIRIRENGNDIGTANFVEFVEATPGYLGSASESDFHLIEEYVEDAEAAADRAEEATTKNPRISETTDNWEIWNASTEQWTDTGVPATGPQGPQGERGPTGYGTPAGGATGQVLRKNTATDYDFVWDTLTGDEIALSDSDATTVTESLASANQAIANLQDGLAIVANGNTHAAITSGQFVYVKNHSTLADGLYKATAAIATDGALSTSNLTAVPSGGMNDLKGQVDALNSNLSNMDFPKKSTGSYTALFASVGTQLDANRIFVYISFPFTLNTVNYSISVTACTILGVSSIDVSTITVDNKRVNGVRLAIAKTGTVRDSYCIEISATISY